MIIFSQDKKRMVDCKKVVVERNIGGGKDAKYVLIAYLSDLGGDIVGSYPEEKNALDELEKIYAAFEAGAKTYSVK